MPKYSAQDTDHMAIQIFETQNWNWPETSETERAWHAGEVWITREGKVLTPQVMTAAHLANTVFFLRDPGKLPQPDRSESPWIKTALDELRKRFATREGRASAMTQDADDVGRSRMQALAQELGCEIPQLPRYAGIGSRQTPPAVKYRMAEYAEKLARAGWVLRSGGARGADITFEQGARKGGGTCEIFTPRNIIPYQAFLIAAEHHPAWGRLEDPARRLLARNVLILLGADLVTPVDVVVYWRNEQLRKGGTLHALKVAATWGIPVFNIVNCDLVAITGALL